MKNYFLLTFALLVCAVSANRAADDQSISPVEAGLASDLIEVVNANVGDQVDPHISGNLVSCTDFSFNGGIIEYYDVLTSINTPIPSGSLGDVATLSSVDGHAHCVFLAAFRPGRNCPL